MLARIYEQCGSGCKINMFVCLSLSEWWISENVTEKFFHLSLMQWYEHEHLTSRIILLPFMTLFAFDRRVNVRIPQTRPWRKPIQRRASDASSTCWNGPSLSLRWSCSNLVKSFAERLGFFQLISSLALNYLNS